MYVRRALSIVLLALLVLFSIEHVARAQTTPVVTPPTLKKDSPAPYPKQAVDDGVRETITVTLMLTLDAAGRVTDATPETPRGHGFDEAATDAARALEFEPATRDKKPMPSRIKYAYTFAPPPGRLLGRVLAKRDDAPIEGATVTLRDSSGAERTTTADASGAYRFEDVPFGDYRVVVHASGFFDQDAPQAIAPGEEVTATVRIEAVHVEKAPVADAGAPKPNDDDVEDVVVHGEKPSREVTKRTMDQRELLRVPGSNGDALRALQNLPGIARPPGLAGLLIVRGSAPQDTQIFVDGTNIPLVYHFGGLSSVMPDRDAREDRFLSWQLQRAVRPRDGRHHRRRCSRSVAAVRRQTATRNGHRHDAGIVVRNPRSRAGGSRSTCARSSKVRSRRGWSFAAAARRSWVDTWLGPVLTAAGADVTAAPVYYDWQAMVQKDWNKDRQFRVLFFGSDDKVDILTKDTGATSPTLVGDISLHTCFWRVQARYRQKIDKDTEIKLARRVRRGQGRILPW